MHADLMLASVDIEPAKVSRRAGTSAYISDHDAVQ